MTQLSLITGIEPGTAPILPALDLELERRETLKDQVLVFLSRRGKKGATNIELNKIHFRYGASIHRLRQEGCLIITEHVKGGVFRYILERGPVLAGMEEICQS